MKKFSPLALIKKYQFLIIGLAVLSGLAAAFILSRQQTYSAMAIIEYANESAEEGLAPDGTDIDTSEIYSTEVMKEVFQRMGLSYDNYNLDEFRSKVEVTPIQTSEEEAVQQARNENGEEVETKPTRYQVTLTLSQNDAPDPETFSRQLLDNMLDVFLEKYGEEHVSGTSFVNPISDISTSDYDYLEAIELIEASVSSTTESLMGYVQDGGPGFTSAENGYSFRNIYDDLQLLQSNEIPDIYAYVLNNRLTKNQDVLISKYRNRIEEYQISNGSAQQQIDDIKEIIETYVSMMRESGNTDITYEYILNQVYENQSYQSESSSGVENPEDGTTTYTWPETVDETVQYDVLLENYVGNRSSYEYALIDTAYCEYIIELYSGEESQSEVLEEADASVTYEDDASASEKQQNVTEMIESLVDKLNVFYNRLADISQEFNEYAGASNINLNSDIVVSANIRILLYSMIVVLLIAVFATLGVIVAGRTGDIINYYIYMDRKLMLPNRTACDRYLNSREKNMLKNNFVCVALMLTDLRDKNKTYGREMCDEMIKRFSEIISGVFPSEGEKMVAVNGLGQFVVFLDDTTREQAEAYMSYVADEVSEYNETAKCRIEYKCGIAEAESDNIFKLRALMICAINKAVKAKPEDFEDQTQKDTDIHNEGRTDGSQNDSGDKIVDLIQRLEKIKQG